MLPFAITAYLILCFMVALLGRNTRLGFFRGFLFSFMLTPFVITVYLLIFGALESETGAKTKASVHPSPGRD